MQWGYCCRFCQLPLALKQHGLCCHCLKQLPPLPRCCLRCGLEIEAAKPCIFCSETPPVWQQLIAVSDYVEPLKSQIHHLKFNGQFDVAKMLARLILLKWLEHRRHNTLMKPTLIVPVPLHKSRQLKRGFNQAGMMAYYLSHWLDVPFAPTLLQRCAGGRDQKTLSATARRQNLAGAFLCHQDVTGQHIALIDDIVTTGSTANEISHLLLDNGAASIQLLCVCRTL